jgi:septal ring factor EnvC (AmiA/AmiB activator)
MYLWKNKQRSSKTGQGTTTLRRIFEKRVIAACFIGVILGALVMTIPLYQVNKQISNYKASIAGYEAALETKDKVINSLNEIIVSQQAQNQALVDQLNEYEDIFNDMSVMIDHLNNQIIELRNIIASIGG